MKKFIVSFIFTTVLFILGYYLITLYDTNNIILPRVITNKYYVLFLYISIVAGFGIYREYNNKSKLLVLFIFLLNFLYLCSIFLIGNIGLTKIQCIIFVGLLFIGFLATLIKNWIGYIIILLSIIGDLGIIYISVIPLYENGPDIEGFNEQFETEFIIYSNAGINKEKASIIKDTKEYDILAGTNEYNFYVREGGSEILFKSDNSYKNSYGFLLFKGGEFIEITPQSALKISEDYEVEALGGNIKYYPQNPKEFKIVGHVDNTNLSTGDNLESTGDTQALENSGAIKQQNEINIQIENDEETINITKEIYNKKLKYYLKQQIGGNLQLDSRILKLSQNTLQLLTKIYPKYEKNLENLQAYLEIFDINLDQVDYKSIINTSATNKNILDGLKNISDLLE